MATPSSPATESDFKRAWNALVSGIKGGEAALGERLYLLGAGPVPVEGATGGALTLDASGGVVLVVGVESPGPEAGAQIARQLSAIAGLPGTKLREAGIDPSEGGGLAARHAAFFELESPAELNTGQRCIAVLGAEPEAEAREALEAGLGTSLAGVFVATGEGVTPVAEAPAGAPDAEIVLEPEAEAPVEEAEPETEVPTEGEAPAEEQAEAEAPVEEDVDLDVPRHEAEEPEPEGPAEIEVALDAPEATSERDAAVVVDEPVEEPPDAVETYLEDESTTVIAEEGDEAAERTGISAWPIGNWVGLTLILAGIGLGIAGAITWGKTDEVPRRGTETNDEIKTVVTEVTPDATHARWIGQQRVVTLTDGTIVFVYPTESSLNFVRDGGDSGDTWEEPFVVEDVAGAESLSVDVDSKDRLHVVYSDGASVNYIRLKNKEEAGWKPSRIIQIDDDSTSLHVDVAWDEQNQTAHVVWVQQTSEGEAPAWAALVNDDGIHLPEQGSLAQPGTDVSVMVNIAADGRSSLLITYRAGDQTTGWASRYSPGRSTDGTWLFNEEERIATSSFVGAADVLYDRQKTAHLVLRDDNARTLVYHQKTGAEPWSEGEIAYRSDSVAEETATDEEATLPDFPTLSYNTGEGNLYLFFQTEEAQPSGEIGYVVQAVGGTGWQGTFDIVYDGDAPEGALYPVAPDRTSVQTIVFWTRTGDPYRVDSAPVVAP